MSDVTRNVLEVGDYVVVFSVLMCNSSDEVVYPLAGWVSSWFPSISIYVGLDVGSLVERLG